MGLDVWFRDDIRRMLLAISEANDSASTAMGREDLGRSHRVEAYREGFVAALTSVALAFGLDALDRLDSLSDL